MRVREDAVIDPDGRDGIFGVVEIAEGISVLPLGDDGTVFLTNEFHYAIESESIEVVSGKIEKRESPIAAAKRELREELGIIGKRWTKLGVVHPFTTHARSLTTLFLAHDLTFSETDLDATERITMVRMSLEDAITKVMNGGITHAPSCVLILKVGEYLRAQ